MKAWSQITALIPINERSALPDRSRGSSTMIDNPPTQRKSIIGERMDAGRGERASSSDVGRGRTASAGVLDMGERKRGASRLGKRSGESSKDLEDERNPPAAVRPGCSQVVTT